MRHSRMLGESRKSEQQYLDGLEPDERQRDARRESTCYEILGEREHML